MTTTPSLHARAADMLADAHELMYAYGNGLAYGTATERHARELSVNAESLIAELRAAAQQSALDELTRENERLGLYEPPSEPAVPKRDRKADRARFHDPAFNRWLDEGISDAGHTVWDQIESVIDAWHGWDNRQFYATSRADPPLEPTRIFSSCPALVAADAIAGALYDFLGYLTTRDETLCMGATQECSPVVPALQAWAKTRNLPLDEANVKGWRDSIAAPAPAQPRQPLSAWIACSERLPEHDALRVIVYCTADRPENRMWCAIWNAGDQSFEADGGWFERDEITHWQPAPKRPIERAITGEKP